MLSFHAQLKVFLATALCDLRMNFNVKHKSAGPAFAWRILRKRYGGCLLCRRAGARVEWRE